MENGDCDKSCEKTFQNTVKKPGADFANSDKRCRESQSDRSLMIIVQTGGIMTIDFKGNATLRALQSLVACSISPPYSTRRCKI